MPFSFAETPLPDVVLIKAQVIVDDRGFFEETYKKSEFEKNGIPYCFVQENHSVSSRGVLRGLHFQYAPDEQGKLLQVVKGAVWDVAVDIRPHSTSFASWFGVELSERNHTMLFVPSGFAHAFLALEEDTHLIYKCTSEYSPNREGGIRFDDPDIGIRWPLPAERIILSPKDRGLPHLKDLDL